MEVYDPSPQTTLLILFGASEWPYSPDFKSSEAFANAARRVKAYFLNSRPFGLLDENLLDLFDADQSADEQDVAIGQFLQQRLAAMKAMSNPARDLLLYFIGHGGFGGRDSDFYLAIRRTRMESPRASGIDVRSLADTLTERARHLRRIIILDCCFAGAAFSAFQAGPDQVALEKTVDAFKVNQIGEGFPKKGTTLLCSSSHKSPSLLLPDGSSTMFTKAFLDTLVQGITVQRDRLSLRDVKDASADYLTVMRNAPRPVVFSPDQSEGDVADIPFFPNPWIEKERLRRSEEERERRIVAEERVRKVEEARQLETETPVPPVETPSEQFPSPSRTHAAMMPPSSGSSNFSMLSQLSGWALVISGVIGIGVPILLTIEVTLNNQSTNPWVRLDGLLLIPIFILLASLGLAGLYVIQSDRDRQIGLVGAIMQCVGNIGIAVWFLLAFLPPTYNNVSQYSGFFNVSNLLSIVGCMLLGIAIVRAEIFPRWAAIVLILSAITRLLFFIPINTGFPIIVSLVATPVLGVALLRLGRALLSMHKMQRLK